jgi:Spy/CpxP family protein refolding chaperone
MNKLLVLFSIFLLASTSLAQPGYGSFQNSSPEERAKIQTDQMREKLNFTDEQDSSIYEINLKYARKIQELMKGEQERDEIRSKMGELMKEKDEELKGILTEEQFELYLNYKKELRGKKKGIRQRPDNKE